jgi:hypothetical protein
VKFSKYNSYIFILALLFISCTNKKQYTKSPQPELLNKVGQTITISEGDIEAVFIDNQAYGGFHRAGYNGIAELRHESQDSTLFVPFYAGFNLEHIFGGDSLIELFEPRRYPMSLNKISHYGVTLHQPETPISHVESWTDFKLTPPHYIDITYRCVIHSDEIFKNGYAGLFWASYIHAPQDIKIYFRGREEIATDYKWIAAYSPEHGTRSSHRWEKDIFELFTAPNFNVTLVTDYSEYRFKDPFYFGYFHNMVFAYFFKSMPEQYIRFAQSPTGGGRGNPAWDFQFIIPDFELGKKYSFSSRLVYKTFVSREDIQQEYFTWKE